MTKPRLASGWCGPADLHRAAAERVAQRSAAGKVANTARNAKLSPEQRRAATAAANAARWRDRTPEEIRDSSVRGARTRWARWTEEQRSAFCRLGATASTSKLMATTTPVERREAMRLLAKARWAKERARRAKSSPGIPRYCGRCEEKKPTKDDGVTCAHCSLVLP